MGEGGLAVHTGSFCALDKDDEEDYMEERKED